MPNAISSFVRLLSIFAVRQKFLKAATLNWATQNIHWAAKGAFTGEISADMLKCIGVEYAIIGHSERRQYCGDADETVNMRTKAALENGILPIVCVGETLEQREAGIHPHIPCRSGQGTLQRYYRRRGSAHHRCIRTHFGLSARAKPQQTRKRTELSAQFAELLQSFTGLNLRSTPAFCTAEA